MVLIFRRLGILTVVAVYLLILVGGIVRSTGAGMGCPDWPKCFGQWIPPTKVSELPENYKDVYANQRKEKNQKLAKYLQILGFSELSKKMLHDNQMYVEADFNALKTWIEYLNRLLGVLIGFLIFLTLIFSTTFFKQKPIVFGFSLLSFVLVGIQGWIGSVVVSTNLFPGLITIHMMLAILIVFCLQYAVFCSYTQDNVKVIVKNAALLNRVLIAVMAVSVLQIVFGTQVRELIDEVAKKIAERNEWIANLGNTFYLHRSFSWIVLIGHISLVYLIQKNAIKPSKTLILPFRLLFACIVFEILTGAMMAYLAVPALLQPIHLLLAVLIVGIQFTFLLILNQSQTIQQEKRLLQYK